MHLVALVAEPSLVLRDVGAGESGQALRQCSALLLEAWQTRMKKRAKSSLSLVILDLSLLEFCSCPQFDQFAILSNLHSDITVLAPRSIRSLHLLIFLIFVLGPQYSDDFRCDFFVSSDFVPVKSVNTPRSWP